MDNLFNPTDTAIELATIARDAAFIQAEIADNNINDTLLYCESAYGKCDCVEELDTTDDPEEQKELMDAFDQIPIDPNDEYEQVMNLVTCNKPKISIDEVMGVGDDTENDAIIAELESVANE